MRKAIKQVSCNALSCSLDELQDDRCKDAIKSKENPPGTYSSVSWFAKALLRLEPQQLHDLPVLLELLNRVPQCIAVVLHGSEHDLPVLPELLGRELQCIAVLLHDGEHDLPVLPELLGRLFGLTD